MTVLCLSFTYMGVNISLSLKEEHTLRMSENRVQKNIFEPKRESDRRLEKIA